MRILDRLEAAGLVERRPHPNDRRVRLLHLTPAAHPLLDGMREIGAATRERGARGRLAEADRERLIDDPHHHEGAT